jgi:hypothetical protein
MNDWLDVHMTQLISFVGLKTKPNESPIDIIERKQKRARNGTYVTTTIKLLNEQSRG